jgi:hypothetical protein
MIDDPDAQFFNQHPDRRARIRRPFGPTPHRDQQRAVRYLEENEMQFRALGPHDKNRRRIIAYRTPADHPTHPNYILQIPMLAFADETISDDDETLLPIIDAMMRAHR